MSDLARAAALGLALQATLAAAATASPPELMLPRIAGTIVVDGDLSDEAWKGAVRVDRFFEIVPGDNVEPPVATAGLLAYDSGYLYVGAICQDPDPSRIRAPYVERDHVTDQDLIQIDVDARVDARDEGRWSMIFRVNPRGVQADGVFDEAVGLDDFSPDFHFQSAARITTGGWSAEMKIPLSTLRYRARAPQTWRITFFRLYPRDFRRQIASVRIPRGSNCWLCHATRFTGITGLPDGASLSLTPYTAGSASRDASDAPPSDRSLAGGADLKWLPQPNLAVDLTLNPDFSQVEADVPQIGVNTRFALFYPEKRPFFLEGADLWNSPLPVVYTRTITDPEGGARLTGRPGNSSYTLLAARDQGGGSLILPGPAFSEVAPQPKGALVFLGRHRYSFGRSSLGTLATVREAEQGYFNRVGGLDLQWYPSDEDHLTGQLLWSATRDAGAASRESSSGHGLLVGWDRSQRHLSVSLGFRDLARAFRADSGFVPQTGIRQLDASAGYSFYTQGRLRSVKPVVAFEDVREPGGEPVSRSLVLGVEVDGSAQASLEWHPRDTARARDGRLFDQGYWMASARLLPGRRLPFVKLTARRGDELDIESARLGTGTALALAATLSPIDRLQAELAAERRWLDVPAGAGHERAFTASVARAKLTATLGSHSFIRLVGEWEALDEAGSASSAQRSLGGSLLYGYQLNWQSILYVGYGNTPGAADPAEPGRRQELFVKIAYAFRR